MGGKVLKFSLLWVEISLIDSPPPKEHFSEYSLLCLEIYHFGVRSTLNISSTCELIERPSKKDGFCFKLFHPMDQSIWASRGPEVMENFLSQNFFVMSISDSVTTFDWI